MIRGPSYPIPEATLTDLVGEQARSRPDAIAVRQWDSRLSYRELWSAAGRLAAALHTAGVLPEAPVCVCLRRRPIAVAALLGVQLAGAAYLPLDPDDPPARHIAVAGDAGARFAVADEQTAAAVQAAGLTVVPVPGPGGTQGPVPRPAGRRGRPDNAAYVLYTSGSTGQPKGVVISHRSAVSFVRAFGAFTGAGPATRSFGFASFGFDVSVLDLFVPLAAGGEVELLGEADRADPERLQRFCELHAITWGCVPVSLLPILDPARLAAWVTLITGAEAPGPEQVERWSGAGDPPARRFLNCYGPTEATVCVTSFEASGRWTQPLPIGTPLANHRICLVGEDLRPVPDGTPGELLIGGAGLARGYLGQPGLTAARFIPDPFGGKPAARLYRTGDIAVCRDGILHFLGRRDSQVKIRGRRVELAEVEAVLRGLPAVLHAVVDAPPDSGGRRLVAFCTLAGGADEDTVRQACARLLPSALVPSAVIRLERFPLNTAGKVDMDALRGYAARVAATQAETGDGRCPAGPAEEAVAAAWRRVLDRRTVAADDDFFASGGHSVAAMRLVADLRSALHRAVSVEDVFTGRTLAGVAERAAAAPPLDGADLTTGNPPALSPAQRRLWFLDKLAPGSAAYNIALAERITGPLDITALRAALTAVARRHDVLRLRIRDGICGPVAEVAPPEPAPLAVIDAAADAVPALLAAQAGAGFDLGRGPLWRAALLRLGPADHVLALCFHHAVFDGWSQRPFYTDLAAAYRTARGGAGDGGLGPLTARFSDYVAWRAERDSQRGAADLAWWVRHLAGVPPVIDLPRDAARPPVQTYRGALTAAGLPPATSAAAGKLSEQLGVTVPAVLLAGFGVLLHRLTGRRDLVIGTPAADRRHPAFSDLVGFFIEVMPLRIRIDPAGSFADLARACSDELLAALAHPAAPLDRIVEALAVPRDPTRPPLVQVLFNVYNFPEPRLSLDGLHTRRLAAPLPGSPFDLTVYIARQDQGYAAELAYNPDLFSAERGRAFLAGFLALLGALAGAPSRPVGEAPLPPEAAAWAGPPPAPGAGEPRPHPPAVAAPAGAAPAVAAPAGAAPAGAEPAGAAPAGPSELAIAAIWRDVLGRPEVGATVNFFDAGGSSLALVTVRERIADQFGRELPVAELFQFPSIRALARHLDGVHAAPELARAQARAAARRGRSRRSETVPGRERGLGDAD